MALSSDYWIRAKDTFHWGFQLQVQLDPLFGSSRRLSTVENWYWSMEHLFTAFSTRLAWQHHIARKVKQHRVPCIGMVVFQHTNLYMLAWVSLLCALAQSSTIFGAVSQTLSPSAYLDTSSYNCYSRQSCIIQQLLLSWSLRMQISLTV